MLERKIYRPITMLCANSIVFELTLYKQIRKTIERKLCNAQHDFRQRLNNLFLLNKILMGLAMNASDYWSINFDCAKTSKTIFIETV